MDIVETLRTIAEEDRIQESWGEPVDITEFMTDSAGFFSTNGLGAFTQIYDREDGRFRPVYQNESDLKLIRAMSWLLVEKVPMAQAWVNRLLDYTVGTGFDWTINCGEGRLSKAVQSYVREAMDLSKWSSELERESYVREIADGEFLGELVYDDGQCLLVAREADELTEPADKRALEEWLGIDSYVPSWTFGVLTKKNLPERHIGYHLVRSLDGTDWDYVPARNVVFWKRNVRSRAKRGFSDFYKPHLYLLRADRVLTNTAEGAATQAAIAYIVEHKDGTQRQADSIVKRFAPLTGKVDPLTGLAQRRRRMLPGTRLDVPEGQSYKAGLLGSNNSDIYVQVMEAALRLAGTVHGFPEGMLTGSYENANLASALVAEGPFMQGRQAEQVQRGERMREMLLKIIRVGAEKGRFRHEGIDGWDALKDRITVEVIPARILPRNVMELTQALKLQKDAGWVSDKTAINELGRDIDVETANGLKVGQAPAQPGAPGQGGKPGAPGQGPQAGPGEGGNVSSAGPTWLGLSRIQWQRNRRAITDVLTDFAAGKTRRTVAKVLLRSIGMPEADIETMLKDAADGRIDSLPPEQMESLTEAERKTLGRPFRTPGGPKKFAVYVKNQKGNVVKVTFGDPKMRIQRDKPGRRRGFRARHNCDDPGPRWKARYWSCRFWSKPSVSKLLKESIEGCIPWDGRTFVREAWLLKVNPRLLEVKDGDGDGKVDDGKASERPADKKEPKKKTKAAIKAETGLAIFKDFEKFRGRGVIHNDRLSFLANLSDDDRSALMQHMKNTVGFDALDRNDFGIAKKRHARTKGADTQKNAPKNGSSQGVSQKPVEKEKQLSRPISELDSLRNKKSEWFDYLQGVGSSGPQDLDEFSKSKGTKYDALHAFTHGAFFDMNLDSEHPASKAMSGLVRSIRPTEHEGPMYRVLGFSDDESRDKFIASLDAPQEKTFASWTYDGVDPTSSKANAMNNIGLDVASQFGDKVVVLRHADAFASKAKDISFAYQSPGANKLSTGTELITGKGHRLGVLNKQLDGDKLIVDVYTKKAGSHDKNVSESYRRGLLEVKDGDGDGNVDDGKASERPVSDSDKKPKKVAKDKTVSVARDDSQFRNKYQSFKEQSTKLDEERIALRQKLKAAKTHEETVDLSKQLHESEQRIDANRWNAATEYGTFHAENPELYKKLRDEQLNQSQQLETENFAIALKWANEVRMRPGVEVSSSNLSMGSSYYDPESFDPEAASRYTEKNSLETIAKYKSQLRQLSGADDEKIKSKVYQAYYGEPESISEAVLGDGSVNVPAKVQKGGADSKLKSFMQASAVAVQVDPKNLASIAEKGVLSASEGGKKGVGSRKTGDAKKRYHDVRRGREEELFGIPDKPEQSRPVYGLIDNPARLLSGTVWAASNYGAAQVVLKPGVKSRTSYTIGDSLDDYRYGGITGAVNDPIDHSSVPPKGFYQNPVDADKNPSTTKAGGTAGEFRVIVRTDGGTREKESIPQYIEAQIHGGIAPSDIAEVRVPRGLTAPSAIKKLQKAGIAVREIPPPPIENFYNLLPDWEKIGND